MSELADKTVDLVVTSPPYPMIEMWDEIMMAQNKAIKSAWEKRHYIKAYELMHQELDKVWRQCYRVLKDGGIACINIGDATRTLDKNFCLYPNHSRIIDIFLKIGFQNLPNVIWRKQTNAPNKFMGSGMLPAGAYVTLEHEHILVFRKGSKREFKSSIQKRNRAESAFFWEERNQWFSDLWEIKGTKQKLNEEVRKRSGAYPLEVPYRLIAMYSVRGDTVLDPFMGTGTTALAAIASNRDSVGYEIDENFKPVIEENLIGMEELLNDLIRERFSRHESFVQERLKSKGEDAFKYLSEHYKFPVMTRQELQFKLDYIRSISIKGSTFHCSYVQETSLVPPESLL